MCVLLITRLLRRVGRWARKPVNHTSWVAVVTPTDRPKSVRNRCLIELFCCVVCVVALPFWHFCLCRGFCHRTGSDLLLFVSIKISTIMRFDKILAKEMHWSHISVLLVLYLPLLNYYTGNSTSAELLVSYFFIQGFRVWKRLFRYRHTII